MVYVKEMIVFKSGMRKCFREADLWGDSFSYVGMIGRMERRDCTEKSA